MPALGLLPPHVGHQILVRCIPPYEAARSGAKNGEHERGAEHVDERAERLTRSERLCRYVSDAIAFDRQPFTRHLPPAPKPRH